jgi:hypothetical protein
MNKKTTKPTPGKKPAAKKAATKKPADNSAPGSQTKTALYTFIGCAHAVRFYAAKHTADGKSSAPDKASAVAAAGRLVAVADSLIAEVGTGKPAWEFKVIVESHAGTIFDAIKTLMASPLAKTMSGTLNDLLDYFYKIALSLMGGGDGETCPHCKRLKTSCSLWI